MIRRRTGKCILLGIVIVLAVFFSFNLYILKEINGSGSTQVVPEGPSESSIKERIVENVKSLDPSHFAKNREYDDVFYQLQLMFNPGVKPLWSKSPSQLWKLINKWPEANRIYPLYQPLLGEVIQAMQTAPVLAVDISPKGTQLKLQLLLAGNQTFVFKPKWYERTTVIEGSVYAGKDRFNSEILAFYLGAVLQLNWTPIAVGRRFNARELHRLSGARLKKTFLLNETSYCFYGQCHYCDKANLVCGHEANNYEVEGVLLYAIPGRFARKRSPWQRTYRDGVPAEWELNINYCDAHVKSQLTSAQLLDLIDGAIFDFLIQNGDRHHYETRDDRLLLLDNGKGFGNPNRDFLDILAPLYQCCTLRMATYERLLLFTGGRLSATVRELSRHDLATPLLTEAHYKAVDRRLLLVLSAIEICRATQGKKMFA